VLLERGGPQLMITLNSPENRNALSVPMRDALTNAFKLVAMDDTIEAAEVRGNGPCFSAGGDLTEFGKLANPAAAHAIRLTRMPARYLAPCADRYTFRLHGACIGAGIELPAFAGRLAATSETVFQLPEVAMGLIPGAGGCVSIPRRIGRQRTAYMAILGERFSANDALAWGLIDAIED
jgi:enoyl-CoA hydratase